MAGCRERQVHSVHQGRVRPRVHSGHRSRPRAARGALLAARRQEHRAVAGPAQRRGAGEPAVGLAAGLDRTRAGLPALTGPGQASPAGSIIDLHVHSPASDGSLAPEAVVERAAGVGLEAIPLTDHDTVAGVPAAVAAGERLGVRVVSGCEFSTAAPWGEMHVLGYFLPTDSTLLEVFLERCRADRVRRARAMVDRLRGMGVDLDFDDVLREARGGAVGRPHVARAIVRSGGALGLSEAFDRYLGRGRPAFVDKV